MTNFNQIVDEVQQQITAVMTAISEKQTQITDIQRELPDLQTQLEGLQALKTQTDALIAAAEAKTHTVDLNLNLSTISGAAVTNVPVNHTSI